MFQSIVTKIFNFRHRKHEAFHFSRNVMVCVSQNSRQNWDHGCSGSRMTLKCQHATAGKRRLECCDVRSTNDGCVLGNAASYLCNLRDWSRCHRAQSTRGWHKISSSFENHHIVDVISFGGLHHDVNLQVQSRFHGILFKEKKIFVISFL